MTDKDLRNGVLLLRAEEALYNLLQLAPEPSKYNPKEKRHYDEAKQVMRDIHDSITKNQGEDA